MDSLVPAFVAALLAGANDRGPWLAAILADRRRNPWSVLFGLAIAYTLASAIAAAGAIYVSARLSPEARTLMLAIALLAGGAGALWRTKAPGRLEAWRLGAVGTAAVGGFILALGDRIAFLAFGFAARGPSAPLAALGAMLGALALAGVAATLGEAAWRRLPLRAIGAAGGVMLLIAGLFAAVSALRLA